MTTSTINIHNPIIHSLYQHGVADGPAGPHYWTSISFHTGGSLTVSFGSIEERAAFWQTIADSLPAAADSVTVTQ